MTNKEWLKKTWEYQKKIRYYSTILKSVSDGYSSPIFTEKVMSSANNAAEKFIVKDICRKEYAQRQIDFYSAEIEKRKQAIDNLADGFEQTVLYLRYIQHLDFDEIESEMHRTGKSYCIRSVYDIHKRGLQSIKTLQ